jgi:S1-C subfamily serine protease
MTDAQRPRSPLRWLGPLLIGGAGGAALTVAVVANYRNPQAVQPSALLSQPVQQALHLSANEGSSAAAPSGSIAEIYQKARPGVVEIDVQSGRESGLGTGVMIDDKGEILTNAHVVSGARNLRVKLADGTSLPATVVGVQEDDDLAIVHANIPKDKLAVIKMGDSSKLKVGQQVIAIGNPFGLEGSVTQGIVSGLRQDGESDGPSNVIQIDAAINPGNSGGPLLDMNGDLVGINEALENPTGQNVFVGIGFAIPVDTAKADLSQLQAGGGQSQAPVQSQRPSGNSGQSTHGSQPRGGSSNNPFDGNPFGGGPSAGSSGRLH